MNRSPTVATVLFLWCGCALAAMYGDFAVPEALTPEVRAASAHGNRVAVAVSPPDGKPFVLYFPEEAEDGRPYPGLQTIGLHLPSGGELALFNVGGRLWVGTRRALSGGSVLYDGYVHRNGLVYNLGFSIDGLPAPDAAVKQALARVRLLPGLNGAPAMEETIRVIDLFETEDLDELAVLLDGMKKEDTDNWAAHLLRGRLAEVNDGPEAARDHYAAALERRPDDIETAARAASMRAMAGEADEGVAELIRLGEMDSDEAVVWEELGKIYLAAGEEEAALGYFGQAACVNPTSEIALYNLSFLHAERKEYEDALRRAREFMHYHSWMPGGTVPDVSGAPGMTKEKVAEILAEPLPLGCVVTYGGGAAALPLCEEEIRVCGERLVVEYAEPLYVDVYVPVFNFDWDWSPPRKRPHKPHKPKPGIHKPKPPWGKPGDPGTRPPKPPRPGQPGKPGGRTWWTCASGAASPRSGRLRSWLPSSRDRTRDAPASASAPPGIRRQAADSPSFRSTDLRIRRHRGVHLRKPPATGDHSGRCRFRHILCAIGCGGVSGGVGHVMASGLLFAAPFEARRSRPPVFAAVPATGDNLVGVGIVVAADGSRTAGGSSEIPCAERAPRRIQADAPADV